MKQLAADAKQKLVSLAIAIGVTTCHACGQEESWQEKLKLSHMMIWTIKAV